MTTEMQIIAADSLRVGHKIVGRVHVDPRTGEREVTRAKRQTDVRQVGECPGLSRTHVHINRSECWDGRALVAVAR